MGLSLIKLEKEQAWWQSWNLSNLSFALTSSVNISFRTHRCFLDGTEQKSRMSVVFKLQHLFSQDNNIRDGLGFAGLSWQATQNLSSLQTRVFWPFFTSKVRFDFQPLACNWKIPLHRQHSSLSLSLTGGQWSRQEGNRGQGRTSGLLTISSDLWWFEGVSSEFFDFLPSVEAEKWERKRNFCPVWDNEMNGRVGSIKRERLKVASNFQKAPLFQTECGS